MCCTAHRELCGKQLEQALQPSSISCAELQPKVADLAATHKELLAETQEQQMQLLGQVRRSALRAQAAATYPLRL